MISVIIPVYNVKDYLRTCIDSVLMQTDCHFEIILVDDGSNDGSHQICDEYSNLPNISVIHKSNGGQSSARNAGIDAAHGEYFLFLDGDDYIKQGTLKTLEQIITTEQNFDYIQFKYEEIDSYYRETALADDFNIKIVTDNRLICENMIKIGGIAESACTKLINKNALGNLRFKEGVIYEDALFCSYLARQSNKVIYADITPYCYVIRPNSTITSKFSHKKLDIIPVSKERIMLLQKQGYYDLANTLSGRLSVSLCTLFQNAKLAGNCVDAKYIKQEIKALIHNYNPTIAGKYRFILKGLELGIPTLEVLYIYKLLMKWVR